MMCYSNGVSNTRVLDEVAKWYKGAICQASDSIY